MKNLSRLNKYFFKYKWYLLLGILFVSLSNYFRIRVPQAIREALDYIINQSACYREYADTDYGADLLQQISSSILKYGLYVIGFSIIMGVFMYFMRQTIIVMSRLIEYDMRKEMFLHYESLDLAFFRKNKTGDLMARITEDVSKVRMYLGPAILYGINLSALFVFVIYAMFKVNATLSLYTLLPLPLLSLSIYLVSSVIHRKSEVIQRQLAGLNSIAQEVYSGIRVVKSYVKEKQFGHYFLTESNHFKDKSMGLAKVNALFYPLMVLLISVSTLLTVIVGGIQVNAGNASPGNIAEFVIYVNMLTWPVTSIGWIASIIQQAEASQERINEFMDTKSKIVSPVTMKKKYKGHIQFQNVSFIYPDSGIQALEQVSFELKPGKKMAILGRTAAGKTSIAELLLRMHDPTSGRIMVDGEDIKEMDLENLRQRIGYVPQDIFLFSDTIANNISFGNPNSSLDQIMEYAAHAAIHNDIMELPDQYSTRVGERGVTLSGGQKQRVSIARALIKNPDIVILDDCLSAVDTTTEQKILSFLNHVIENKTAIIITHRVYNLLEFDKIIIVERGSIVEEGTHDELMKQKGYYYDLVQLQGQENHT